MRRKPKYKFWKETKNFRRKPKISEGNQKFWKENKIKFWKETKKIGIEILTPLGHRSLHFKLFKIFKTVLKNSPRAHSRQQIKKAVFTTAAYFKVSTPIRLQR